MHSWFVSNLITIWKLFDLLVMTNKVPKFILCCVSILFHLFFFFIPMCNLHNAAPEVKPAVKACRDLATLPYRPIRARLAGQWEAGLKYISIIWISGGRRGGIVWVNPSSKCASCHSNETDQRNIHTHVNVSLKAYVYDETIYNSCARARFAGCTSLRHIILGLNTVYVLILVYKMSIYTI